ncbi:hypothetical protein [Empedobacter tilapiae]|uniref:hypothetical protein n=1 Tax=Empedobacter tilapiae TaxID=2491114 RepID=UPI0028D4DD9F|nr:hypothetical protein [Empedobacter tilapiae]
MKQIFERFKLSLLFLVLFFNSLYSQVYNEGIVDENTVYTFEGEDYNEIESKKEMIFSEIKINGSDTEGNVLNNNKITVGKEGIYRITLLSNLPQEEVKEMSYVINLNSKEAFQAKPLDKSGKYYFQIQLKKGDSLSFDVIKGIETGKKGIRNRLEMQFLDPDLIKFIDNH